jgi:hypothetical protein
VVEDAQQHGIAVVFAGCSRDLKASLKACGLYRRVGGPLMMHSTEEVYSLLVEAPAYMPHLASQGTTMQPPPDYFATYAARTLAGSPAGDGAHGAAIPRSR